MGVNKILDLMREQGIRSISEEQYRTPSEIRESSKLPVSDLRWNEFELLDDRVEQVIRWGRDGHL